MSSTRSPYTTDVSDEEWAFVAPYLTLLSEDAGQRRHDLREVYNGVRYIVKTGAHRHTAATAATAATGATHALY